MTRVATLTRAVAVLALLTAGCAGEESPVGLDQPVRVQGAVWKAGNLPGQDPLADDEDAGVESERAIEIAENPSLIVFPQQVGKLLKGRASDDAYAVAVRFRDIGTGYWVKPLDENDPLFPGTLDFTLHLDFAPDVSFGYHVLELVAIDGDGKAGRKIEIDLCAAPTFDNLINACEPTSLPPAAVISLSWDQPSDIDLVVKTPSGKIVNSWRPATLVGENKQALDPSTPGLGYLLADSNRECNIDGFGREDLVWQGSPEPGRHEVYVNLYEACGVQTTHFRVQAYVRTRGDDPGTFALQPLGDRTEGVLLLPSANGGKQNGLYVTTIEFP